MKPDLVFVDMDHLAALDCDLHQALYTIQCSMETFLCCVVIARMQEK
jgi:hypothetical protein